MKYSSYDKVKLLGYDPDRYIQIAFVVSTAITLLGLFISIWNLLLFPVIMTIFIVYPHLKLKELESKLEAELPKFIRTLGLLRRINIDPKKALEIAAKESNFKINLKKTPSEALVEFAYPFDLKIKRTVMQIVNLQQMGNEGDTLLKMAKELEEIEKHKMKIYGNKASLFSMLFISTAILLPTMLTVYLLVADSLNLTKVDDNTVYLAVIVASILIILVANASRPTNIYNKGLILSPLVPGMVSFIGFYFDVFLIGVLGILMYVIFIYLKNEKNVEEMEKNIPNAFFSAGILSDPNPKEVLKIFSKGYGKLSDEAKKSLDKLNRNMPFSECLENFSKYDSNLISRAIKMLKLSFESGKLDSLNYVAEDILTNFQLNREHQQQISMQKYTIIAGAIIAPIILKTVIGILEGLDQESTISLIPYLTIYASLGGTFIAQFEREYKAHLFSLIMFLISMATLVFS